MDINTILTSTVISGILSGGLLTILKFWMDKRLTIIVNQHKLDLADIENKHNRDNDRLKTKLDSLKDRHQVDHQLVIDSLKELWQDLTIFEKYLNNAQKTGLIKPREIILNFFDLSSSLQKILFLCLMRYIKKLRIL